MIFKSKKVLILTPPYMLFVFFLIKYTFELFYPLDNWVILFITIIIGLLNTLPAMAEENKSRPVTRLLMEISAIWMWASLMFLFDIIIIYPLGRTIPLSVGTRVLMLSAVPLIGIYANYKAHKLVVNEETLKLDNLKKEVNIVHVSDVHFGAIRYKKIITQLADILKDVSKTCDMAIISGDLADGTITVNEDDFLPLKDVDIPIIFTPGNHDYYLGIDYVIKACKKAGIIILDNESMEIDDLNIYGLSYSFDDIDMPSSEELQKNVKNDKTNILIYHVPYEWPEHSKMGFDIQLSGHTHGGQFYPIKWLCELSFKYNMGLFKDNQGHYLNVSTGVGSMNQPLRWGTDSEVVILKLRKN